MAGELVVSASIEIAAPAPQVFDIPPTLGGTSKSTVRT